MLIQSRLQSKSSTIVKRWTEPNNAKLVLAKRPQWLRNLCKPYNIKLDEFQVVKEFSLEFQNIYQEFTNSKEYIQGMKFTKFINKNRYELTTDIKKEINDYSTLRRLDFNVDFKMSTKFEDMLRCSETNHFTSCFAADKFNRHILYRYIAHPKTFIIYNTDKSGKFVWRFFCSVLDDNNVMTWKLYGNCPNPKVVYQELSKIINKNVIITHHWNFTNALLIETLNTNKFNIIKNENQSK